MTDYRRMSVELGGGMVGGVLQVLVGHPLDTVKVRVQSQGLGFKGPVECIRRTARQEGLRGFYKGVGPPLLMSGFMNGIIFAINGQMKRLVAWSCNTDPEQMPLWQVTVAACMTAPTYCVVLTPIELVKSKLQYQASGVERVYAGPMDVIGKTVRANGVLGLYQGYLATTATRVMGAPFYFVVYDYVKRLMAGPDNKRLSPLQIIAAGGLAGSAFWAANYPIDMAKTRIQTHRGAGPVPGILPTMRQIYSEGGIGGCYRGFSVCMLRSFPANGAVYLGLEMTLRLFGYSDF